jgi:hypothetical protein
VGPTLAVDARTTLPTRTVIGVAQEGPSEGGSQRALAHHRWAVEEVGVAEVPVVYGSLERARSVRLTVDQVP